MAVNIKLGIGVFFAGALAVWVVVLASGLRLDQVEADVPGPRTFKEVAQIATELGLYYRNADPYSTFDEDVMKRLVVSDRPLTSLRAIDLRFKPGDCRWGGTAAVTLDRAHVFDHYLASDAYAYRNWVARWGDFFLFGDPTLIRRLSEHKSGS
jgi:hypothetical protein